MSIDNPKPLNPIMVLPMENLEYPYKNCILEYEKQSWFSKKNVWLYIIYYRGERIYRVIARKTGLFKRSLTKDFINYDTALRFYVGETS